MWSKFLLFNLAFDAAAGCAAAVTPYYQFSPLDEGRFSISLRDYATPKDRDRAMAARTTTICDGAYVVQKMEPFAVTDSGPNLGARYGLDAVVKCGSQSQQ